jgi:cytochrome c oxidase subunit II
MTADPSPLAAAGPQAGAIADLTWILAGSCGVIFLLLLCVLAWAVLHRRTPDTLGADDARRSRPVLLAIGATVVVLCIFVGASYATDRKLLSFERDAAFEILLIGHQWWWEIRYLAPGKPAAELVTANELHLPAGQRVRLTLKSVDVIHSLWIPAANGKRDIIPGRENGIWIEFDRPGIWKGRCAEFCGLEHAKMELVVVVQPPDDFAAWKTAQLQPAAQPADPQTQRGQKIFARGTCALCHQIRGVTVIEPNAVAPDLTHLKSRLFIGAGAAPNAKGYLGGWVVDPHGLKPGVHMPVNHFGGDDLRALLAYLETLQ